MEPVNNIIKFLFSALILFDDLIFIFFFFFFKKLAKTIHIRMICQIQKKAICENKKTDEPPGIVNSGFAGTKLKYRV